MCEFPDRIFNLISILSDRPFIESFIEDLISDFYNFIADFVTKVSGKFSRLR